MVLEAADVKNRVVVFLDPELKHAVEAPNYSRTEEAIVLLYDNNKTKRFLFKHIKGLVYFGDSPIEEARNMLNLLNNKKHVWCDFRTNEILLFGKI